jgi:5-methylcytosine-specific restriction endonuclease McrA
MITKTSPQRLAYLAKWRDKNRESLRAYQIEWAKNNPDKVKAKAAKHIKLHPEMNAAKSQRRRARERNCKTFLVTKEELAYLYNQPCNFCGSKEEPTLDHCIPLARGGDHSIGNLQTLCKPCNSGKRHKTNMEWRMYELRNKEK